VRRRLWYIHPRTDSSSAAMSWASSEGMLQGDKEGASNDTMRQNLEHADATCSASMLREQKCNETLMWRQQCHLQNTIE
jgi:hypothetical protein